MPPSRPSWIRWQVALWVWGEPAFLAHMDRFWQTNVVNRVPTPYDPSRPANGWWPLESMDRLGGEFNVPEQRAYGLTAIREEDDQGFFNDLANVLENKAWWHTFGHATNLICMTGCVTEKPAQYLEPATDVGVQPPKPGIVLLSPQGRANGKSVDVYRCVARYSGRPGADDDIYSTGATAALTQIWLDEFSSPRPQLEHWRRGLRAGALDLHLPKATKGKPRGRF